jgi:hypothetical protein
MMQVDCPEPNARSTPCKTVLAPKRFTTASAASNGSDPGIGELLSLISAGAPNSDLNS